MILRSLRVRLRAVTTLSLVPRWLEKAPARATLSPNGDRIGSISGP